MLQSIRDLYDLLPLESVNYDDFLALYAAMKHYLDLIQGARDIPSNALSVPALLESIADHVIDGFHSLLAYSVQQQPDSQLAMILLDDWQGAHNDEEAGVEHEHAAVAALLAEQACPMMMQALYQAHDYFLMEILLGWTRTEK